MDIWIIREGEKVGPLHDFEIRRKIETGELPGSTPAWHEGLAAWKPLDEIEIFTREYERTAPSHESGDGTLESPTTTPPPLPVETFYLRRFWARWLDLSLYSGLWWLGMWAARQNIESAMLNSWVIFLHYLPWFVIETLFIHRFSTTPGKWLLGLSVVNKDGSPLEIPAALHRSLRVLFTGIGFGWPLLTIFCQLLSLFTAKRLGAPLWDHLGGHRVYASPLSPFRILAMVCLYVGSYLLLFAVVSPAYFKINAKALESLQPPLRQNPFWHLPDRSKQPE